MKWLDDMKEAGAAFKEWGWALTIIGAVMAGQNFCQILRCAFPDFL